MSHRIVIALLTALMLQYSTAFASAIVKAPDFKLKTIDGAEVKFADYKGKPVIIHFWASWCGPCIRELPDIQKNAARLSKSNYGLIVISVDANMRDAKTAVKKLRFKLPVADDSKSDVSDKYGVTSLPKTFIVSADGTIEKALTGMQEWDNIGQSDNSHTENELLKAARDGDIRTLLKKNGAEVDINARDFAGRTALILACRSGDLSNAKALLEKGADVKAEESLKGFTPLIMAADNGDAAMIDLLLEHGADINGKNRYGMTPLALAVEKKDIQTVSHMLKNGADPIIEYSDLTVVTRAAKDGSLDIVKALHYYGADINEKEWIKQNAPLSYAVHHGHKNVVQYLMENADSVNLTNIFAQNHLIDAASNGRLAVVKYLIEKKYSAFDDEDDTGKTSLAGAVEGGHADVAKLLIEHGASIAHKDKNGRSVLEYMPHKPSKELTALIEQAKDMEEFFQAAQDGDLKTVQKHIAKGKSVDVRGSHKKTALMRAAKGGKKDIVKYLLDKGANLEARATDNGTALLMAAESGEEDVVDLLLARGADTTVVYFDGFDYFMSLARGGLTEKVKEQLAKGGNIDKRDNDGDTALHWAAKDGDVDVIKSLIALGADINAQSNYGYTPLMRAALKNKPESIIALLESGARIDEKSFHGNTALALARLEKNKEAILTLVEKGANQDAISDSLIAEAIKNGEDDFAVKLIEKGIALNNAGGTKALDSVVENNKTDLARLLLEKGAPIYPLYPEKKKILGGLDGEIQNPMNDGGDKLVNNWFLVNSIYNNNAEMVGLLLKHGADVTGKKATLQYVLLAAMYMNNPAIIDTLKSHGLQYPPNDPAILGEALLACDKPEAIEFATKIIGMGAAFDRVDDSGATALWKAVAEDNIELAKLIIESSGAKLSEIVNSSDLKGVTPLHTACEHGFEESVNILLDAGADVNAITDSGKTPLMLTALGGHVDIASQMLAKGAVVDQKDFKGATALAMASLLDDAETRKKFVNILITAGADVNNQGKNGFAPISGIVQRGDDELFDLFVSKGAQLDATATEDGLNTMVLSGVGGSVKIADKLIKSGLDVNHKSKAGTALQLAVISRRHDLARYLLDHGANPDIANENGQTPLVSAVENRDLKMISLLLERGANPNIADKKGDTALNAARGDVTIAKMLKSGGAAAVAFTGNNGVSNSVAILDILSPDADDPGLLNALIKSGLTAKAISLMAKGADLNRKNANGDTPLITAARYERFGLVINLIERGADVNAANKDGKTALMYIADSADDYANMVSLLLEKGAKADAKDHSGKTALDYAKKAANGDSLARLIQAVKPTPNQVATGM